MTEIDPHGGIRPPEKYEPPTRIPRPIIPRRRSGPAKVWPVKDVPPFGPSKDVPKAA